MMETRVARIVVVEDGMQLFHESATAIEIEDDAAGEFVFVRQCSEHHEGSVRIVPEEWPAIREAIDRMIKDCRS